MLEVMAMGAYKVSLGVIAFLLARLGLLWMDRNSDFTDRIQESSYAPIYFGLRFIGVAIVVGVCVG